MSLINDALKRAKQFQQPPLPHGQPPGKPAQPPSAPAVKPHERVGWSLPVLVILLIATAAAFIGTALFGRKPPAPLALAVSIPQPVRAAAPPKPFPPPAPSQTVSIPAGASPPAPAPVQPPPLKVQGIFFFHAQWQAIVNGTAVYVGDNINGFRVKEISRDHVSFTAADGSQKTLALGE